MLVFMISDKTVLKIAVVVFAVGFFALFLISQQEPKLFSVSEITENMIGEKASVRGIAERPRVRDSLTMQLADENSTAKINVVMFNPTEVMLNSFKAGDAVIVNGEISIYKGELEIIANKISKIE
jgi:DNA/RNA endonuclease YhcR with UshA esterase domain